MIQSFKNNDTKEVFLTGTNRRWKHIAAVARRKLDMLSAAKLLSDLKAPRSNHLEALKRDRKGQHSIRINLQYRVYFVWKDDGAYHVEITDITTEHQRKSNEDREVDATAFWMGARATANNARGDAAQRVS